MQPLNLDDTTCDKIHFLTDAIYRVCYIIIWGLYISIALYTYCGVLVFIYIYMNNIYIYIIVSL